MQQKKTYTPGMREVLKLSKAEAGVLGHNYIGPEHYLLAIIRKGGGSTKAFPRSLRFPFFFPAE
ncbi:hypothetical protein HY256_09425 [Candidatus Sumerlaeota bacterium]|nr:hypothetical protein [Candidatus Sumerlaeota bacterium]